MSMEIVGIALFVLLIGLSIALHELGHLIPAKIFGVRVTQYMVGFGPTIWSRTRGETQYGLKAIPVGGYIRMIGMLPPGKDGTTRSMSTGRFASMISDARQASLDEMQPGDEDRAFYRLPVWKRLIIMLGGPVMNLALAFILFGVVLVGIGTPSPSAQIAGLVACTPTSSAATVQPLPSGNCPTGSLTSPAAAAGLQSGDRLVGVGPIQTDQWDEATAWIRANPGRTADLVVVRDGTRLSLPVTIAEVERPVLDSAGEPTGATETVGFVGIRPAIDYVGQPLSSVPPVMWSLTQDSVVALISLPVRLYELVDETLIGGGERELDSPVSVVGASRLGGEIAALDDPVEGRIAIFLGLAASLNLFLFLFNLLPILPLDGGHVAAALYEGSRRTFARLTKRPDPGPVDTARLLPVAYVVAVVLIGAGAIVIFADLVKPITLG
ncbi:MAG: site-2 protease family protein [Actinobacteria bacterium]|nr:site-2 protease family protein [Actinomycetota bacterium]